MKRLIACLWFAGAVLYTANTFLLTRAPSGGGDGSSNFFATSSMGDHAISRDRASTLPEPARKADATEAQSQSVLEPAPSSGGSGALAKSDVPKTMPPADT